MSGEMQFTRSDDSNGFITRERWVDVSGIPQSPYKPDYWKMVAESSNGKIIVVKMNGWTWHIHCAVPEFNQVLQHDGVKNGNVYVAVSKEQFRWFAPVTLK